MSAPTKKEENSDDLLTQWEREMKVLEDWLNNPEPKIWLPTDSHADCGRGAFSRIAQKFQPRS
jgi:hypothetical protein